MNIKGRSMSKRCTSVATACLSACPPLLWYASPPYKRCSGPVAPRPPAGALCLISMKSRRRARVPAVMMGRTARACWAACARSMGLVRAERRLACVHMCGYTATSDDATSSPQLHPSPLPPPTMPVLPPSSPPQLLPLSPDSGMDVEAAMSPRTSSSERAPFTPSKAPFPRCASIPSTSSSITSPPPLNPLATFTLAVTFGGAFLASSNISTCVAAGGTPAVSVSCAYVRGRENRAGPALPGFITRIPAVRPGSSSTSALCEWPHTTTSTGGSSPPPPALSCSSRSALGRACVTRTR
mmetsp:Transcript_2693/g.6442  ORF Transcript_2693/g.6442 Transcript_2693/m.6442 type:complete len:297 (+) Transcript_2693:540-1430(+)